MNWKSHPHLFANGKFKVFYDEEYRFAQYDGIVGIIYGEVTTPHGYDRKQLPFESTQLIARPIEDMTDEESKEYMSLREERYSYDFDRGEKVADGYCETTESFLYLLSIGCYPFDQDHFNNGDVIDIRRLKNE